MKSVVLAEAEGGRLRARVSDLDAPVPGEGELLVDMEACGLCGTDLEKMRGEYVASKPVLGHEAVGTVSALGPGVSGFSEGDRVFPHHHVPCHSCYLCKRGKETMCDSYRSSNLVPGGFSESFVVPRWNVDGGGVFKLPGSLSFETASLIEPLACCVRGMNACRVRPGDSVLVAGAGPVGMMHALLLKAAGATVMVSDISEARLEFARRAGVGSVIDARKEDVPSRARGGDPRRGADVAIVASGSSAAILQALRAVRKGGTVCIFGVPPKGSVLDYDVSDLYNSEQTIITSYGATEADVKEALDVLTSREGEFSKLVTHRFPLERFPEAVEAASKGEGMKVVVTP